MSEQVNHPNHYGGKDSPYEVIKIAEHYNTDLYIFNLLKYCLRAGVKSEDTELQDLKKGLWYLQRKINRLEQKDLTINIKWGNNLSPILEEMHENTQRVEANIESPEPKKISELKVGDEIRAIKECYRSLIKNKMYPIIRLEKNSDGSFITIKSELYKEHTFDIHTLHEYFHVTK